MAELSTIPSRMSPGPPKARMMCQAVRFLANRSSKNMAGILFRCTPWLPGFRYSALGGGVRFQLHMFLADFIRGEDGDEWRRCSSFLHRGPPTGFFALDDADDPDDLVAKFACSL